MLQPVRAGRWLVSATATAASTCALEAIATTAGLVLAASGLLAGLDRAHDDRLRDLVDHQDRGHDERQAPPAVGSRSGSQPSIALTTIDCTIRSRKIARIGLRSIPAPPTRSGGIQRRNRLR